MSRIDRVETGWDMTATWSAAGVDVFLAGARDAHGRLVTAARRLSDRDVRAPSHLPGWTRAHVLTHLARNADGQRRMLEGAISGIVVEQYPGGAAGRAAQIADGAARPAAPIVADLVQACAALEEVWRRMPANGWSRPTSALAGRRPAWQSAWARWRESEVHLADLNVGYQPRDWPSGFTDVAIEVLAGALEGDRIEPRLPPGTGLHLRSPGGSRSWTVGGDDVVTIEAPVWALVAWLMGRLEPPDGPVTADRAVPKLAPWA